MVGSHDLLGQGDQEDVEEGGETLAAHSSPEVEAPGGRQEERSILGGT